MQRYSQDLHNVEKHGLIEEMMIGLNKFNADATSMAFGGLMTPARIKNLLAMLDDLRRMVNAPDEPGKPGPIRAVDEVPLQMEIDPAINSPEGGRRVTVVGYRNAEGEELNILRDSADETIADAIKDLVHDEVRDEEMVVIYGYLRPVMTRTEHQIQDIIVAGRTIYRR